MAIDNVASGGILTAYNCSVWGVVGGNEYKIGIVDSVTMSKNIQTQRAMVIGDIMPASVDPQSLTASISLSGFITPKAKPIDPKSKYGSGDTTLATLCPDDELINSLSVKKIPELIIKDKGGNKLCIAEWCIVSSYQIQAQGQGYIKANVQLEAITMNLGNEYTDETLGMNK